MKGHRYFKESRIDIKFSFVLTINFFTRGVSCSKFCLSIEYIFANASKISSVRNDSAVRLSGEIPRRIDSDDEEKRRVISLMRQSRIALCMFNGGGQSDLYPSPAV